MLKSKIIRMKNLNFTLLFIAALTILSSCKNDLPTEGPIDPIINDCSFEQNDEDMDGLIDATERSIMEQCANNALLTKSEIEDNLIGEWELIGHGEGWVSKISQPCGHLTITADDLTLEFENAFVDTVTMHSWEIEELNWGTSSFYSLKASPDNAPGLSISQFCSTYMYGDGTPRDGNMYLYEKVE